MSDKDFPDTLTGRHSATRAEPKPPHWLAMREGYDLMRAHYGHLGWWPGETPFEVCVGAILTQNTSWRNVEKCIAVLKQERLLEPRRLYALPEGELAAHLRPSGYFNIKAKRLRAFLKALVEDFGADLPRMLSGTPEEVRTRLLAVKGIGPETADSMVLYAAGLPAFVIDAYTLRIFSRHSWCSPEADYTTLQRLCTQALDHLATPEAKLDYWKDYHAQLVMVGKDFCLTKTPRCETCPLRPLLPASVGRGSAAKG